jgi:Tol biopolymer transport system component
MSWPPGTRLGPYEILAPIGSGGMGEVHRARDTRLNRDVAIKAIPAAQAGDEALRLRFEREAKAISSLNHPHICTLYDVGHAPGMSPEGAPAGSMLYLVMELLEGESLADRLAKGPLPLHEVLKYGRQIASALDAAHRQGIVHRDLKPGNIMLTRAGAKLLDFGLARTAAGEGPPLGHPGGSSSALQTALAADARPLTAQGMILGTLMYMAPEQLEGSETDPRTDIFALGALLHEMATGARAFQGTSRTSLIAAIVSSQPPPISSVALMAPPALDHLVRRCLEKDPADRWQSAHDVAAQLQWIGESGSQASAPAAAAASRSRQTRERLAWGLAALLAIVTLGLGVAILSRSAPETAKAFRSTLMPPPDGALIPYDQLGLALSPDGRTLAFVAVSVDARRQIWLRNLDEMTARAVPETAGAAYPFWSPDGRSLGFFAEARLKTIDLRGGAPRVLAEAPTGRGGSWNRDGFILFAPNIRSPILRIHEDGGKAEPATTYDPETEITHRWPVFLPDGKHFLYVARAHAGGSQEAGRLMLATIDGGAPTLLIDDASNALYVESGYLIYGRSSSLYAWRFDTGSLHLQGQPVPIVPEKLSFWEAKNFVPFTASDDGTLVFLPDSTRATEMRWYDRQGRPLGSLGSPGYYSDPRISPDGRRVAYMHADSAQGPVNMWVRDLPLDRTFRLTQQSGRFMQPAWAPDSDRLVFLCQPKGVQDLCTTSVAAGGVTRVLFESSTWKNTGSWMPDGKRVLYTVQDPATDMDIMMLDTDAGAEPTAILRTPFVELSPEASPDSSRMAYVSTQSGRQEVYVRGLQAGAGQWQISTDGGTKPRWRRDGRELFYVSSEGYVMAVPFAAGAATPPGTPVRLFQIPERPETFETVFEDVTPDGQRILLNVPTSSRSSISFHAITHWPALVGKRESRPSGS